MLKTYFVNFEDIPNGMIEAYLRKSGDDTIRGDYALLIEENYIPIGFITFHYDDEYLYLDNVFSDERVLDIIRKLKNSLQLNKVMFATKRNYKTFERKYKAKLVGYIMELDL